MTVGFTKNAFEVVRAHYVAREPDKNLDEVTPVVQRALGLRDEHDLAPAPERVRNQADALADIATVLTASGPAGPDRMRSENVRKDLAQLNPDEYGHWTAQDLKAALEPYGVEPRKVRGVMVVFRDGVLQALHERDTDEDSEDPDTLTSDAA